MHQYRIYTFREDGHFSTVQRIECTDEKQAVQKARQLVEARMVSSGRVTTLSPDFPTCRKQQTKRAALHIPASSMTRRGPRRH